MKFTFDDLAKMAKYDQQNRNLTQKQYAERIGLSEKLLNEIEKGDYTNVTLEDIGSIAKALNLPNFDLDFTEYSRMEEEQRRHDKYLAFTTSILTVDPQIADAFLDHMEVTIEKARVEYSLKKQADKKST